MRALAKGSVASILFLALLLSAPAAYANTITVTANCTLAQAITTANDGTTQGSCASGADNAADTIIFQASISEIVPTADLPQVTESLTIDGGANGVTINGKQGSDYRKLLVVKQAGINLTINNVTFKNAGYNCQGPPSECESFWNGGAIYIKVETDPGTGGTLTIANSTFDTCYANDGGGCIYLDNVAGGTTTIRNSVFRNGGAELIGGAIMWKPKENTTLTIEDSLLENNEGENGGALYLANVSQTPITLTIRRSVFRNNVADNSNPYLTHKGLGGAISTHGSTLQNITIENSTFYGNQAKGEGGALYLNQGNANGSVTLKHVTIVGNTAPANKGGGIMAARQGLTDTVKLYLYNTLLANNGAGKDCHGTAPEARDGSLHQDGSCGGDTTNNPLLGAVTGEGAQAHYPLRAGSPAIDIGSPAHCLPTDQIGTSRPQGGKCDAGAIERPFTPPPAEEEESGVSASASSRRAAAPAVQGPPPAVLLNQMGYRITATHGLYSGIQCKKVGPEGVGIDWVLERGFIDAIDCWGYVEQGVEVCFPALGAVVFLDASTSPRSASMQYSAYIAADNYTCVNINQAGTIVLVEQGEKPAPAPAPADIPPVTETALQNCMVTTLYALNFRDAPDGKKIGGVGYMWTLTALAKSGDWYKVDNNGVVGWISAMYVSTHGVCGV